MLSLLTQAQSTIFILLVFAFFVEFGFFRFEDYFGILGITTLSIAAFCIAYAAWLYWKYRSSLRKSYAHSWLMVAGWQTVLLLGTIFFWIYQWSLGSSTTPENLSQKLLLGFWVLLMALGAFSGIGVELSRDRNPNGLGDLKRIRRSMVAWTIVGMAFVTIVCVNYIGSKRDKIVDWTYLKTTTPSHSTVKMVESAGEHIDVGVFFTVESEVRPFVQEYFEFLKARVQNLGVVYIDKDLSPSKAEEFKVSRNGLVIFKMGDKRERLDVGNDLAAARQILRKFDSEVQRNILRLKAPKKKLYFTRGHGEFNWTAAGGEKDQFRSIDRAESLLRSQNYHIATLAVGDYVNGKIPDDAAGVVIVGPDAPFLKQETEALREYLSKGGKLAVFLDPMPVIRDIPQVHANKNDDDPLIQLLAECGLKYQPAILANDRAHMKYVGNASDRWFTFTNSYSSHEAMTTLVKVAEREPILLYRSASFDVESGAKDSRWRASVAVRSLPDTFADLNRNFNFDEKTEKRQTFTVGAFSVLMNGSVNEENKDQKTLADGKIFAFADANVLSDALIRQRTHAILLVDTFRWLTGQADLLGEVSTEEDIKIQHSNKENAVWFNSTIFLVPILILILGFVATRPKTHRRGEG